MKLYKLSQKDLNGYSDYYAKQKNAYLSTGRSVLRAIANHLQLAIFDVRINRAGSAVSGDITLMGMLDDGLGIYIHMSEPHLMRFGGPPQFYFRTITHMKDYTGGANQWMSYEDLAVDLGAACKKLETSLHKLEKVTVLEVA